MLKFILSGLVGISMLLTTADAAVFRVNVEGTVSRLPADQVGNGFFEVGSSAGLSFLFDDSVVQGNVSESFANSLSQIVLFVGDYEATSNSGTIRISDGTANLNNVDSDSIRFDFGALTSSSGLSNGLPLAAFSFSSIDQDQSLINGGDTVSDIVSRLVADFENGSSDGILSLTGLTVLFSTITAGSPVGFNITSLSLVEQTSEVPLPAAAVFMAMGLAGYGASKRKARR